MNRTQMKVDRRRSNLRASAQQSYHSLFFQQRTAGPPVLHSRLRWLRPALRDGSGSSASRLQIHGFSASSVALW
jgi:hypothetical protein